MPPSSAPIPLDAVRRDTPYFVGPNAPKLYLREDDEEVDSVAYLLRCKPLVTGGSFTWYVGRVPLCELVRRMKKHVAGTACDFTATTPDSIC
jgi:hypothetical protein